jgi:Tol biopolymer transport system component
MTDLTERLTRALADRYRIERALGAGGMATVYLAEDLKHDRKVALKVLKPELAAVLGGDRFVQEIKTTAALQHPHILPLFDSGEADGFLYYVMPYIEGETLRDKLDRDTQLSVDEAVRITTEVADALDYAHRNGVIHRDIKPENVLLHDGRPMVADFGIALALSAAAGGRMTETGMSLGTPHYMSPEQATADKDITARSDVYSLASVLYEMLAGEPPHMGNSAQQIIMKIIAETAKPVTELRRSVPPNVAAAVGKALEKLPADRFDSAKAFAEALGNPVFTTAATATTAVPPSSRRSAPAAVLAATTVLAMAVAAWGWLRPGEGEARPHVVEFTLEPPDPSMSVGWVEVSPDGRRIVGEIATDSGTALYQRTLADRNWRLIQGTEGGAFPFISPDGLWVGFESRVDRSLKRAPIDGGTPQTIVSGTGNFYGASWGRDNTVVFSMGEPDSVTWSELFRVSADGGVPEQLTAADSGEVAHVLPYWTDGDIALFAIITNGNRSTIAALSVESGRIAQLGPGLSPLSAGDDRLTYVTPDGILMAQGFDPGAMRFEGPPRRMAEGVAIAYGLVGDYSISRDGVLVYRAGSATGQQLMLVDRAGRPQTLLSGPRFSHPRFSPSGDRIAYILSNENDVGDLWVYSLRDGTAQKLTADIEVADPAWMHDGRTIGYSGRIGDARAALYGMAADGTGSAELLLAGDGDLWQVDFAPGDREVVFRVPDDVFRATIGADPPFEPLLDGAAREEHATVSNDGRWLAYISNETGVYEVYVRSYPDMGPRTIVSVGGGAAPVWSADGTELLYWGRSTVIAASVRVDGNRLAVVERTELFRTGSFRQEADANRNYDVHPSGQEFVMVGGEAARIVVRVGAFEETEGR